jgi:cyclohexanone monooxygenase
MTASSMKIAIIGAGLQGISAGYELLKNGMENFTIFELSDAAGGAWHQHHYPGLCCDVWAHYYTFSWAPNPEFTANFVDSYEVEAYLQKSAKDAGLMPHMMFDTFIASIDLQDNGQWLLTDSKGNEYIFDAIINAMGNQHTPILPDVQGIENFKGDSWHSTYWDHSVNLTGKRVVVVGSAAAAVQIVPEVAKVAGSVTVMQRTPNYIMPRGRSNYSPLRLAIFKYFPYATHIARGFQTKLMSIMHHAAISGHKRMEYLSKMARDHLNKSIEDKSLIPLLTPNTEFGCKRPLVSDDFYTSFNQQHVSLVAEGVGEVTESGVVTSSGKAIEADVIIYCTGYRVLDYDRIDVTGRDGAKLAEVMGKSPAAYKGIAVPGFPNYFLGMGPNSSVLSASFFYTAEEQVRMIIRLITEMKAKGGKSLEAKPEKLKTYNEWISRECANFSWAAADCTGYYTLPGGGSPFLYPGNLSTFKKDRGAATVEDFQLG